MTFEMELKLKNRYKAIKRILKKPVVTNIITGKKQFIWNTSYIINKDFCGYVSNDLAEIFHASSLSVNELSQLKESSPTVSNIIKILLKRK